MQGAGVARAWWKAHVICILYDMTHLSFGEQGAAVELRGEGARDVGSGVVCWEGGVGGGRW